MLIAITGKAGAGKDLAAAALVRELRFTALPFAGPLKDSCMFKFGLSEQDVRTQKGKQRFVPEWGLTVGEILQQEGTEATKGYWGQDFWVKRWMMDYEAHVERGLRNIVVTDCRFNPEAQKIVDLGGKIIKITRPGHEPLAGRNHGHASEAGIDDQYVSSFLVNGPDVSASDLQAWMTSLAQGWINDDQ